MKFSIKKLLVLALLMPFATSCATTNSFPTAARPGDTIILPVGWNQSLIRQNITITITPSSGSPIIYGPNDPNVRAVVNLYPDPVSRLIVGTQTHQGLNYDADIYGASIDAQLTNQDKDWYNTIVYLRLPSTLPPGSAAIDIIGPEGPITQQPAFVEILPSAGGQAGDPLAPQEMTNLLGSLERAEHYTVTFTGSVVPHSIQLEMAYSLGTGKAWVVNPRGDLKNLLWTDTGSNLRVMMTPANGQTPEHLTHFKFYVAGNITGLQVTLLRAYDIFGNLIPGVSASVQ